jgi:hypothetical protein
LSWPRGSRVWASKPAMRGRLAEHHKARYPASKRKSREARLVFHRNDISSGLIQIIVDRVEANILTYGSKVDLAQLTENFWNLND